MRQSDYGPFSIFTCSLWDTAVSVLNKHKETAVWFSKTVCDECIWSFLDTLQWELCSLSHLFVLVEPARHP